MTQPILTPMLTDRRVVLVWVGAGVGHLLLSELGLPGWPCPFRHVLNMPCPGCGLTRATHLLLHGQWQQSLATHAFAPLLLLVVVALLISLVLPSAIRQAALRGLERLERRTGVTILSLLALMGYWLVRLLFFKTALYALVM